jgi:hypothetical protein
MKDENTSEAILFIILGVMLGGAFEVILRLAGCSQAIL